MSLPSSRRKPTGLFAATAVLILSSIWFAACATGSKSDVLWDPDENGTGNDPDSGLADGGDSGDQTGGFGDPCTIPANCASKQCTPIGQGANAEKVCTESCTPGSKCRDGAYCAFISGRGYQCIPDRDTMCSSCTTDSSCKGASDKCLESPFGDRYCARDCSWDGICPKDFKCVDLDEDDGADSDGGVGDPEDGGVEDAGAGDAGAGGDPSSKKGNKYCVPVNDKGEEQSCDCDSKRKGITRSCSNTSVHGTCVGSQSCDGKAWSKCDARKPEAEVCDGIDNDCDGEIDNALIDQLCPLVPQGTQACNAGKCTLTGCEDGWTNFPPGPVSEGCQCQISTAGDSCATATHVGSVSDTGSPLEIAGTLSDSTRESWYVFDSFDTIATNVQSGATKYHVSIRALLPTPNNEFLFDVRRGNDCSAAPNVGLVAYDWCADFTASGLGQLECGYQDGRPHCGGNSSRYYVRVYRNPALPENAKTCRVFKLSVGGNGTPGDEYECNAASQCVL